MRPGYPEPVSCPPSQAFAVVGAGFGDEGKGLMVDAQVSRLREQGLSPWVVRFNGGAQAGHTVVTPTGQRHVFHHVGAGALAGAPTFLSSFFVLHPMLFERETEVLHSLNACVDVAADPDCPVTTPFDILINQALEASRGAARHGSCGIGFGETWERHTRPGFELTGADLGLPVQLRCRLEAIRDVYVPQRLAELGLPLSSVSPWLESSAILERFMDECQAFHARMAWRQPETFIGQPLVFEGAQGLLLDQDRGVFPHVTRSNTGLQNVMVLAPRMGVDHLHTFYMSRAYRTRHGAGPLEEECPMPFPKIEDLTNQPNAYQGHLRFALLDVDILKNTLDRDRIEAHQLAPSLSLSDDLVLTCLDQCPERFPVKQDGRIKHVSAKTAASDLASGVDASGGLSSWGPTRSTLTR